MSGRYIDTRMDRRSAVKWMLVAFGSLHGSSGALAGGSAQTAGASTAGAGSGGADADLAIQGYGKDPDLLRNYLPGELWPLTFTPTQRGSARWLVDQILPAAGSAPAAGILGVHDFIDEWVSAPYEPCRADRPVILEGLDWLDKQSRSLFASAVVELSSKDSRAMIDLISDAGRSATIAAPAAFFGRFRKLAAIGYFTTPAGMQDLGYVGNRPSDSFDGPSEAVLRKAGVKI